MVCSGRLRPRERVGLIRREREQRAAVVEHEAGAVGNQPGPEAVVIALDERHHVAVAIDDRQVDRVVPLHVGRPDRGCDGSTWHCARPESISAARVTARLLVEHRRHGHLAETLVADVPEQVGIGELLGFDHRVQRARRVEAEVAHRERLHEVEHHERGDALAVGRESR